MSEEKDRENRGMSDDGKGRGVFLDWSRVNRERDGTGRRTSEVERGSLLESFHSPRYVYAQGGLVIVVFLFIICLAPPQLNCCPGGLDWAVAW